MTPSTNRDYRRLRGVAAGTFYRHTLWLGADHLLCVGSSFVGERYRRFYFADIEGFVWRRTRALWIRLVVWAVFLAGFGATAWFTGTPARFVWLGLLGVSFVMIVIDLVRGPTLACFIKTAVQFEQLRAVTRPSDLRKLLAELRPHLDEAQAHRPPAS